MLTELHGYDLAMMHSCMVVTAILNHVHMHVIVSHIVVPTLKETCMNVIMSNLLQQLNLNADQLQDRLPDYVPTTLRKAIVHNYKARTPI